MQLEILLHWIYVAAMVLGALTFAVWSTNPQGVPRYKYLIAIFIVVWSGAAHLGLALDQGRLLIAEQMTYYARYLDWIVTTPLLLLALSLTAMYTTFKDKTLVAGLMGTSILMILAGLIADLSLSPPRFVWYGMGVAALLVLLWGIWWPLRIQAESQGPEQTRIYRRVAGLLSVVWVGYPLVWLLGPSGLGVLTQTWDTIGFLVLALLSTVGWNLFDLYSLRTLEQPAARRTDTRPAPATSGPVRVYPQAAEAAAGQRARATAEHQPAQSGASAWHTMPAEAVLEQLGTSSDGLRNEEVAERQEQYGRNEFPKQEAPTLFSIILHQFTSPLIYILLIAAIVSVVIGDVTDAIFIFAVLLINAALGTYQEWRAEQSAAALQSLLKISTRVRRNQSAQERDAEELVPGDIVLLESGDKVAADLRLLNTNNLSIDESFLTGESVASTKTSDVVPGERVPVSDRVNIAYAGATVMSGRGSGVVVGTGLQTELGKIAQATTQGEETKPPLVMRMERFVNIVSIIVVGAAALLMVIALAQGTDLTEVFFLAVALAVSAIPEGLPVAMTVALSIAVHRMVKRHVIVRKMPAVEGLGSCTLIASDKTGTLTVNRQTVKQVVLPSGERFSVSGEGYAGEGEVTSVEPSKNGRGTETIQQLARAGILCNEGMLEHTDGEWKASGDAVDVALLAFGYKAGYDPGQLQREVEILHEIPFESERQYAAVLYREDGQDQVAVKGAMEKILSFCTTAQTAQGVVELDPDFIEQEANRMAEEGYRVLAVAQGETTSSTEQQLDESELPEMTLLGLVGMIDPLRPEVKTAVETCKKAGVEVAMVTGDHPATALTIARELGIAASRNDLAIGRDLPDGEQEDAPAFLDAVKRARVFARVSPLQKLRIIEALRKAGHFVAVTGDGVNDAPALRAANIGVAMGSGTDVAKDTASIIVTDDNFASIVAGIAEGRFAYDNVRKVIYLLISTGAAEIALFLAAIIVGLPLPLLAVQLLWLNLVTNGIQGVALAFEEGEPGAMERPARPPTEGIFNGLMIQQVLISAAVMFFGAIGLWYWLLDTGWEEGPARNLLLLLMVLFQNFHVFNCRSEYVSAFRIPVQRNRFLVVGVIAALGVHLLAMWLPFLQPVLQVAPVSLAEFGYLALFAGSILIVMEIYKLIRSRSTESATYDKHAATSSSSS